MPAPKTDARHEKIRAMLIANNVVSLGEFCVALKCSESTIRNDLKYLEGQGLLTRTFGGAVANESTKYNISMNTRDKLNLAGKKAIARFVVNTLIKSGDIVTLDSGTTNREIARCLLEAARPATVITNSLAVITTLAAAPGITLYASGGMFHPAKSAFIDEAAAACISGMRSGMYFMSCDGFSAGAGATISDPEETAIKQEMARCAAATYCVADSSKAGQAALKVVLPVESMTAIVTDAGLPEAEKAALQAAGATVLLAAEAPRP